MSRRAEYLSAALRSAESDRAAAAAELDAALSSRVGRNTLNLPHTRSLSETPAFSLSITHCRTASTHTSDRNRPIRPCRSSAWENHFSQTLLERRLGDAEAEVAQARLGAQHALEDYEGKMNSAQGRGFYTCISPL